MLAANSEVLPLTVRVVAVTVPGQPAAGWVTSATPFDPATALPKNVMPGP
jgi:hypothetical protein